MFLTLFWNFWLFPKNVLRETLLANQNKQMANFKSKENYLKFNFKTWTKVADIPVKMRETCICQKRVNHLHISMAIPGRRSGTWMPAKTSNQCRRKKGVQQKWRAKNITNRSNGIVWMARSLAGLSYRFFCVKQVWRVPKLLNSEKSVGVFGHAIWDFWKNGWELPVTKCLDQLRDHQWPFWTSFCSKSAEVVNLTLFLGH